MANAARGEVDIELNGKTYTLRPSFAAMAEFEDTCGINMMSALIACNDVRTCTLKIITTAVYTGIRGSCDSNIERAQCPNIDQLGEWIMRGKGGYSRIMIDVVKYIGNGMMDDETLQENAAQSVKN